MPTVREPMKDARLSALSRRLLRLTLALSVLTILGMAQPSSPALSAPAREGAPSFPFDNHDCGPPATTIPGPPPEIIRVGTPMSDAWLMCYIKQDFEGQTFFFDRWGDAYKAAFRGYPVECWNEEIDPAAGGRQTPGIVAQVYGWNLDRTQYVRFTYRIQMDGDYINNCNQEILPTP